MSEQCTHEDDIAVLKYSVPRIEKNVTKILEILEGNGKVGLKTQTELNKASLFRLWWFTGSVGLLLVAGIVGVFFV